MKQLLLAVVVIFIAACGGGEKKELLPQYKDKSLDIAELIGFIGKSYSSVENSFKDVKTTITTNLGDKTVETFVKDNAAPIKTYSLKLIEKNGVISKILIDGSMSGHEVNRDALKYYDDKLTYTIGRRLPIDAAGSVKAFWTGTKDEFYTYLRNNPDFGGWITYATTVNLSMLAGQKTSNVFGFVIENK